MDNYAIIHMEKHRVPVEVVKSAPWMGGEQESIHISEVNYCAENNSSLPALPTELSPVYEDKKHLDIHTEILSESNLDLLRKQVINGTGKQINQRKIVCIFALGKKMLYDYTNINLYNATYAVVI
jgi:acyl-CoA hydrolase